MVGGTTHQPQQDPQRAPPLSLSSTAPTTTPEEDELLKRNTDCVYFLASPLTCKKGSECEYRHSDIARVNPRDCWYWLNGSCLNPKCGFRHPPLDGLLGADVSTPMGPSVPAPHAAPYAMPKQGVACIFFQKGFCLKGHLCPFLHGPPNSVNNKAAQSGSASPVTEPPKMAHSGPEKSFQDQKFTQQSAVQKPVEFLLPQGKQAPRMQAPLPARNGGNGAVDKKVPPPSSVGVEEPPRFKAGRVVPPLVMNETPSSKPNRGVHHAYHVSDNDRILNGKDADEYSREPSPGFDVLVDNVLGDSEYYHNKEEYGRSRGNGYDLDRPIDYDVDREMYRDYDRYNERDGLQGEQHAWDDPRSSSERMLGGSAHLERRSYPRSDSPDHFDESDLRHRISKQRRGSDNGLRSVVSREGHDDRMPRRDSHHHRSDQGALSSRLRGRIKIPGRPPSINQSRLRDRIKGRVSEHRDMMSDNDTTFAGPKRLSELKTGSYEHQLNDEQVLGKRKYPRVESRQSEEDLSFEGPKPLSEILKRKRGIDNPISSVNTKDDNQKEKEIVPESTEEHNSVSADLEPEKQTGSGNIEKDKSAGLNYDASEVENDGGLVDEDALLDEELEAYDHGEGEYEYEQIDGEEEGEYVDEEEGDEYGKKEGVVYS